MIQIQRATFVITVVAAFLAAIVLTHTFSAFISNLMR